ncbi:hypothetical protein V8C43DRAFT_272788 [Trichoderma afarasin]
MPNQEELRCEERFALVVREWEQIQVHTVTVREFSMVAAMNTATDKMDWHINIFDKDIVNDWCEEALAETPLMSGKAWAQ